MTGTELLIAVTLVLVAAGVIELLVHRRNLRRIPIRVHVNGTRGKSSVTRLIAAGLREAGIVTCAKTTGTLARMILPDGHEVPIFRPAGANIIEQRRIVATAAAYQAQALIIECMALQPELQSLSEFRFLRATHGVITNARPDHLEIMGPDDAGVARALTGMTPVSGKVFTAERNQLEIFARAAADRKTELIRVGDDDVRAVTAAELAGFSYTEHPDNVALALRVCAELGVARDTALAGMQRCAPDPGALTEHTLDFFGRHLVFLNGFAANDPVSTQQLWETANLSHPELARRIAIFNCRTDRPDRSMQLGRDFVRWLPADRVVLMGTGTYLFARAATRSGYDATKFLFVEDLEVADIFERLVAIAGRSALIMGMGNIGGQGLDLVRYFANRALPKENT